MEYGVLGIGIMLVALGLLCYRFPKIISGLNTMPAERLAMVDVDALKKVYRIVLCAAGVLLSLLAVLGASLHLDPRWMEFGMIAVVVLMTILLVVAGFRYDHGRGMKIKRVYSPLMLWITMGSMAVVIVVVVVLLSATVKPVTVQVEPEGVTASGMYGFRIGWDEVVSLECRASLPPVAMRVNGSAVGSRLKGHFVLDDGERCMLLVDTKVPAFIEIRTDKELYYLNTSSAEDTEALVAAMQAMLNEKTLKQ